MKGSDYILRCAELLEITLPTDEKTIKSAFRAASKKYHPDKGGDSVYFIKIKDAYDYLINCGDLISREVEATRTHQGDLLSELGKGLGRENGKTCYSCNGLGYYYDYSEYFHRNMYSTCYVCEGKGETPMFNPCLPKFKIAGSKQQRRKKVKKSVTGKFYTGGY